MRLLLLFAGMLIITIARSQAIVPSPFPANTYSPSFTHLPVYDSLHRSKWSFNKYVSLSTGFSFFKGGNASFVAAPVSLQLNRRLNNNLYAFTGVSAAPLYTRFNGAFLSNDVTKTASGNPFLRSNSVGMYSKAELGLMYINDAKTFSISGSIGVERNSAPLFYSSPNTTKQNPVFLPNR